MDAISLLKNDHRKVEKIFSEIEKGNGNRAQPNRCRMTDGSDRRDGARLSGVGGFGGEGNRETGRGRQGDQQPGNSGHVARTSPWRAALQHWR